MDVITEQVIGVSLTVMVQGGGGGSAGVHIFKRDYRGENMTQCQR